ncbi:MAG: class I SAM-dependent methyltransferase [Rhodocyclaceae bacterium]|nr:class I SAM-dependent methyltransferase [Rhodocyclaceae bacterium]
MTRLPDPVEVPCPLCGCTQAHTLYWTTDYLFGISDHRFGVKRCDDCGAGYLSPRPTVESIADYYPEAFYWSWEGADGKLDWPTIVTKRMPQLRAKARWLDGIPPGRLLDIGAQKGEFLWFMQQKGWTVEGVELDQKVPNPAHLPIRYGDFLAMEFGDRRYDAITFWAVLEHVYEPHRFFAKAATLLQPGGHLIALVTNLNSIQARYYQADDFPRHLTLFTRSAIRRLCSTEGLTLDRLVTDQKIFAGTLNGGLLYMAKRALGYAAPEALAEWKQLDDPDLFWCKWRGTASVWVRMASHLDRLLTQPVELLLDRLGCGFILTFSARRDAKKD